MPLDPAAEKMLDLIRAAGAPPIHEADLAQARVAAITGARAIGLEPPAGVATRDLLVPDEAHCVPVRTYRPSAATAAGPLPAIIFFHGGGWVVCNLDSHDSLCRHLALAAHCTVVAVDYRLAPEHPFPAAPDDAVAVLRWIANQGECIGIDGSRVVTCGDSAGGNLAAVVGLHAARGDCPRPRLQILVYPVCDVSSRSASYTRNGRGYVLPETSMRFFIDAYLPDHAARQDWRASPLLAPSLAGSPPTLIYTAEYDVLHDEGCAFADRLRIAGAYVEHHDVLGHMHGFLTAGRLIPKAAEVVEHIGAVAQRALAPSDRLLSRGRPLAD